MKTMIFHLSFYYRKKENIIANYRKKENIIANYRKKAVLSQKRK